MIVLLASEKVYEEWYESGVTSATLEVLQVGSLGADYKWALERRKAYNDEGVQLEDVE